MIKIGKSINPIFYFILLSLLLSITEILHSDQSPSDAIIYLGTPSEHYNNEAPYFHAKIDSAGFSDWIYFQQSPQHPYWSHELLSGEWASAIFYDNIEDDPKSMWLTNKFLYPDWYTSSNFVIPADSNIPTGYWNDPNSTVPYYNTARTVIENNQVRIRIDYEVVDLGWDDPNNWVGSPLACWDMEKNKSGFARSDRYIFLQTYTITNILEPNQPPLENLEFYQMLHSHGADDYGGSVCSVYQKYEFNDPLEDYTPYNPIHQVGKFNFDIT
jgi:hypothetical protein